MVFKTNVKNCNEQMKIQSKLPLVKQIWVQMWVQMWAKIFLSNLNAFILQKNCNKKNA